MKKYSGFTLIELMVTLMVAAILVGVAIPSMSNFLNEQSLVSDVARLKSALSFARSEAITRSAGISVCASTDGATCSGGDWADGWIVFRDQNGNMAPDLGTNTCAAAEDCVLRVEDNLVSGTSFVADAAAIGFNLQGERLGASATRLTICHPNARRTHQVSLAVSGAMSVSVREAACP